jgi:hypothetical protein
MRQNALGVGWLLLLFALAAYGCATHEASPPPTIPANSAFSRIKQGMGMTEVFDILGRPSDQEIIATGKAFIPFYFGADQIVVRTHYKGQGRITFSSPGGGIGGGAGRVINIDYDPTESGYRR